MEKLPQQTETTAELSEKEKSQKQLLWEQNHADISTLIMQHLLKYGSMPAKTIIAQQTGLSRETVYKHLKATSENNVDGQTQLETFGIMVEQVTARVLKAALSGDLNAAKLFLKTARATAATHTGKQANKQNSYIQINKTIINQQIIQQLKPEQLNRIEQTIANELGKNTVDNG